MQKGHHLVPLSRYVVLAVHPVRDQIVDNLGLCQGGCIAERAIVILCDLAQDAAHDPA